MTPPEHRRICDSLLYVLVRTMFKNWYSSLGLIVIHKDVIMPTTTMECQVDYFECHKLSRLL